MLWNPDILFDHQTYHSTIQTNIDFKKPHIVFYPKVNVQLKINVELGLLELLAEFMYNAFMFYNIN